MKLLKTLSDFTVQNCIREVIEVEGGYVNNQDDRGGETNYGITKETAIRFKHLWQRHQFNGNMRSLTKGLAYDIYLEGYWNKNYCSDLMVIHPLLAYHVFDMAVNSGNRGNIQLQELLNVLNRKGEDYPDMKVDGSLGPTTLRALQSFHAKRGRKGIENLIISLVGMQMAFYINISKNREANETFTYGWLNRSVEKLDAYYDILR